MNERTVRRDALAGIIAPLAFLAICFTMAVFRQEVIRAQGWASWPSAMALGNAGIPQIFAFLLLAASYPIFALGAVRPALHHIAAWGGFLVIAAGDALLAFRTDAAGAGTSWHGTLHLIGVLTVTIGTVIAAAGVTFATRRAADWRVWRRLGAPIAFGAVAIGAAFGLDQGWAKIVFVVGITLPVPLIGALLRRKRGALT